LAVDGPALPAKNPGKFIAALLDHCIYNLKEAHQIKGPTFFDRGIPDVAAYAIRFGVDPNNCYRACKIQPYNHNAFILPPWEEIFVTDALRGKSFEAYLEFHKTIIKCYKDAGFQMLEVPMSAVEDRADFVLEAISNA
jgi:predicted ATPase